MCGLWRVGGYTGSLTEFRRSSPLTVALTGRIPKGMGFLTPGSPWQLAIHHRPPAAARAADVYQHHTTIGRSATPGVYMHDRPLRGAVRQADGGFRTTATRVRNSAMGTGVEHPGVLTGMFLNVFLMAWATACCWYDQPGHQYHCIAAAEGTAAVRLDQVVWLGTAPGSV